MTTSTLLLLALVQPASNAAFFAGITLAGATLAAGLVFGMVGWRRPAGKALAIASGVLLLALGTFGVLVLALDWRARHGSLM
jgi:hypothetical protein